MMASDFIIDVNEIDFENQVLAYSQQIPVIVDFWAEWCAPCRVLGPILEKLTNEAQGSFRLAKVNVDNNPNLARQYQVRSIPVVKAFRDGKIASEFLGVQPEKNIREFIKSVAPSQDDLELEKGLSLLAVGQAPEAETCFRQVLNADPDHTIALLGLTRSLLFQSKGFECLSILKNFPPSREMNDAQTLLPLAEALVLEIDTVDTNTPVGAAYQNAIRLIQRGNFEAAMDGLLDILREDKRFGNGVAKKLTLAILGMYGDNNPVSREYRNELASILF